MLLLVVVLLVVVVCRRGGEEERPVYFVSCGGGDNTGELDVQGPRRVLQEGQTRSKSYSPARRRPVSER